MERVHACTCPGCPGTYEGTSLRGYKTTYMGLKVEITTDVPGRLCTDCGDASIHSRDIPRFQAALEDSIAQQRRKQ